MSGRGSGRTREGKGRKGGRNNQSVRLEIRKTRQEKERETKQEVEQVSVSEAAAADPFSHVRRVVVGSPVGEWKDGLLSSSLFFTFCITRSPSRYTFLPLRSLSLSLLTCRSSPSLSRLSFRGNRATILSLSPPVYTYILKPR